MSCMHLSFDSFSFSNLNHVCLYRVREFRQFSDKSDVYSFGVFLLELVSGREAMELLSSDLDQNLVEWVPTVLTPY